MGLNKETPELVWAAAWLPIITNNAQSSENPTISAGPPTIRPELVGYFPERQREYPKQSLLTDLIV